MYDRQLLLGPRRNAVLKLWEIQQYGTDSYQDPDYVSVYGRRPADWYAAGVRLLGRTAVECTRDVLGDAIAADIAAVSASAPGASGRLLVDPFAGSCNTLYWMQRRIPATRAIGFETDAALFALTRRNLAILGVPVEILNTDYRSGLAALSPGNDLVLTFVAPPWGEALNATSGLDLRQTTPPVAEVVDAVFDRFRKLQIVCAVQVYEKVAAASLSELRDRFDWSTVRIYRLNAPGQNHGVLLGTRGWVPRAGSSKQ
jgi:hypothetical protein